MKKQTRAFTLVELIVVIVILAILGTIAFISFQGYSKNSRDSVRIADINNLEKSLGIYVVKTGFYPIPDNSTEITYLGGTAWIEGTIGDTVIKNIDSVSKKTIDPLTGNEYTYSITTSKKEYEIGTINEGSELTQTLTPKTYAATNLNDKRAIVKGTYNQKILKVSTGCINYILAVPSILATDLSNPTIENIIQEKKLVYNNYTNIPHSYNPTQTGGFNYETTRLIVYSGAIIDFDSNTNKITFLTNLKEAYNGTIIGQQEAYKDITNIDPQTEQDKAVNLVNNYITNNVGGISGKITTTCNSGYSVVGKNTCATQPTYTHASYTIGTPTQPNQSRQNTNNTNPCYYTCTDGYTGTNCEIAPIVQYTSNCTANGQIYYADSSGNKLATVTNAGVATWESGKSILDLTCAGHIIVCSGSNTGYTLQACNLGATTLYIDQTFTSKTIERSTAVDARAGYLYQWGRNKGFTGPVTQQKTTIAGTVGLNAGTDTYGFVWSGSLASPYTWANSDITNNWGDTTGTSVARQGPCASGYHVPAQTEWSGIVTAGGWGSNGTNLMNSLKMPMAGDRLWGHGTMFHQGGYAFYWSSSPNGTNGYSLIFNSYSIYPSYKDVRAYGFSLRCIKN